MRQTGQGRRLPIPFWVAVALVWLVCSALYCWALRDTIAHRTFLDPDDEMRLLQVRAWLAGQSWFDVTQYRLDPPHGYPMHWSRLVDIPIAAVILLAKPFVGVRAAETIACAVVPMLTLGVVMAEVAALTRRLVDARWALLAAAYCTLSFGSFYAIRPLRIDHHGWQIAIGLAMVLLLTGRRDVRRTAAAGAMAALWMHISLEGIAFTAAAGAWLGMRWALWPMREEGRLPAFLGALTAASLGLFLVAHGGALFDRNFCDVISPVHMVMFGVAAIGCAVAVRVAPSRLPVRLAMLAVSGIMAAAVYRLWAPQCAAGPFGHLDPLAYKLWYLNVSEGMPVWHKPFGEALMWVLFPAAGAAVSAWRWWATREDDWLDLAVLLGAATAIGATVLRAGAFSNMLAIPAMVTLLVFGLRRVFVMKGGLVRTLAASGLLISLTPVSPGFALMIDDGGQPASADQAGHSVEAHSCLALDNLARLDALPAATVMNPLDVSTAMLLASHQNSVGAGYHRDPQAMADVLHFWTGDTDSARTIAKHHDVRLVVFCSDASDLGKLAKFAPQGLAAKLLAGEVPRWLHPVSVPGLVQLRVYAVSD